MRAGFNLREADGELFREAAQHGKIHRDPRGFHFIKHPQQRPLQLVVQFFQLPGGQLFAQCKACTQQQPRLFRRGGGIGQVQRLRQHRQRPVGFVGTQQRVHQQGVFSTGEQAFREDGKAVCGGLEIGDDKRLRVGQRRNEILL